MLEEVHNGEKEEEREGDVEGFIVESGYGGEP